MVKQEYAAWTIKPGCFVALFCKARVHWQLSVSTPLHCLCVMREIRCCTWGNICDMCAWTALHSSIVLMCNPSNADCMLTTCQHCQGPHSLVHNVMLSCRFIPHLGTPLLPSGQGGDQGTPGRYAHVCIKGHKCQLLLGQQLIGMYTPCHPC